MNDDNPDILVITFGPVTVTNPQLDNLVKHTPGAQWELLTSPMIARDRLLAAIDRAIAEMSDRYGVVHEEIK